MSDYTPPPPPPGAGGPENTPPPPPPPPSGGYGYGYGGAPGGAGYGPTQGERPGELLDRFVARLVDLILVGVVNAIVSAIVIVSILGLDGTTFGIGGSFAAAIISAVLSTAIGLGYFAFMESRQGKTLGKMIMKLHVVGASGGKPTMEEAVKRNIWMALPLLGVVPILGGLVAGLGEIVAIVMIAVGISTDTVRRQPWTDKYAGTQVIKET